MKFYLKIFVVSLLPVLMVAFFFGLSSTASAAEDYFIEQLITDGTGGSTIQIQSGIMPVAYDYIGGITFYPTSTGNNKNTTIYLCAGTGVASGTPLSAYYCDFGSSELVATSSCFIPNTTSAVDCTFDQNYYIGEGNDFYFSFNNTVVINRSLDDEYEGEGYGFFMWQTGDDPYFHRFANPTYWSRYPDLKFRIYEDDALDYELAPEAPENEYLTIPDPTLDQWRSDINTVYDNICFLDEPCEIWFSFNDLAIGKTVYLTPFSPAIQQFPEYAEASTTIEWVGFWQDHVDLPAESVATTTKHCIYLEDSEYGDYRLCGIVTKWISEAEFMDGLEFSNTCNCDSVATSSGSYWDDFRYGVECGTRQMFCWMFLEVDPTSIAYLKNNVNELKASFPLNTFFSLTTTVQDAISSTTLNNSGSIDVPYMDENKNLTFIPAMSSSSMANMIGEDNANGFRILQQVLLYGMTAGFLLIFSIRKFL
jgi:hypothetical protein